MFYPGIVSFVVTVRGVLVRRGHHAALSALALVLCGAFVVLISTPTWAQDDFFRPVLEATPTRVKEGPGPIFSFARLEPEFKGLCRSLEEDGRRERLVSIAEAGVAREKVCITCRSFWKMIVNACGKLGPRPTPKPKSIRAKKGKEGQIPVEVSSPERAEGVESKEGVNSAPGGEQVPVTSTVAVAPPGKASARQVRYPSTEVLDGASRISVATYTEDSGEGQVAEMFRYFEKSVRDTANLSAAEREYYDILFTYLLAAWAGRVDSTKLPTPTPSAELESFFE